ncbi:piccolo-like protein [Dinothrombium tinctorium]|uniref:Piccolo-like protein n=1 Tax=Dinothrombium tinctorium TaxID=1965070 RepID=A0A3S3RKH2_9ACAR|nr:piccolo-like protein [Dinothrombium tinctorium]
MTDDYVNYSDDYYAPQIYGNGRRHPHLDRNYQSRSLDAGYDEYFGGNYYGDLKSVDNMGYISRGTPSEHWDHMSTPAMPILPDVPTRSRKLLEDLGSSPIGPEGQRVSYPYYGGIRNSAKRTQASSNTSKYPKYPFPVKRILLTRDPKERSINGSCFGMRVIGGKEIPGSDGMVGAFVAKIVPGGVVDTLGEVREGHQVLEWNGVPLTGKSHEEVQRIISSTANAEEVEVIIRSDINVLDPNYNYTSSAYNMQQMHPQQDNIQYSHIHQHPYQVHHPLHEEAHTMQCQYQDQSAVCHQHPQMHVHHMHPQQQMQQQMYAQQPQLQPHQHKQHMGQEMHQAAIGSQQQVQQHYSDQHYQQQFHPQTISKNECV